MIKKYINHLLHQMNRFKIGVQIVLIIITSFFANCNNVKTNDSGSDTILGLKYEQNNGRDYLSAIFYNPLKDTLGIYWGGILSYDGKMDISTDIGIEISQFGKEFTEKNMKKKFDFLTTIIPRLVKIAPGKREEILITGSHNIREVYNLNNEPFQLRIKLVPVKEKLTYLDTSTHFINLKNIRLIKDTLVSGYITIK